jgi:hypothetical protein
MSGGHFDYSQFHFEDTASSIDKYLLEQGNSLPEEIKKRFILAAKAARRAGEMIHEVDYLICGDTGDDTFLKRWKEKFETFAPKAAAVNWPKDKNLAATALLDGVYDLVEIWQPSEAEVYNKKWRESWLSKARELGANPSW